MYSKSGGKNGKHGDITKSSSISAVSFLAVQIFQPGLTRNFQMVTDTTSTLQTRHFF
ncbi:hypothetical protein CPB83DRAFT_857329 [Crepidotus variabilis]|uniref:Uncharacterized protein n=1 Tax=Crepidotus variabilis TaxID=179855 RepID=A0A9P6JN21_9AGAR|nr:hypothetical protein CPB83DRAFT_857329 [Crepidotus variabilis]